MSKCYLALMLAAPALLPSATAASAATVLHVGPRGSGTACTTEAPCALSAARDRARAIAKRVDNPIVISLAGGDYRVSETFVLMPGDSGVAGAPVTYEAAAGQSPRISGGLTIGDWHRRSDGIYVASVPAGLKVRQLYVDGRRATRARTPNGAGYVKGVDWRPDDLSVVLATPPMAGALVPAGAEFVANRHWQQHRLRVVRSGRSPAGALSLEFDYGDAFNSFNAGGGTIDTGAVYYLENARAFLDAPGEWFHDETANQLLYVAPEGRPPREAVVPVVETLWRLQGTPGHPVHDVVVRGLTFEHAAWNQPSREGFAQVQAVWISSPDGTRFMPGAVEVRGVGANNVRFERNTFRHLGTTALTFFKATRDNQVVGNTFTDLSAGALAVDAEPDRLDINSGSSNFEVRNNRVSDTGRDYTGSVGMFFGYVGGSRIEHNSLVDLPYSAISVGWGWTSKDNASKNNVIRANLVKRAMLVHDDGGAIYLLSKQPGTLISENYISEIRRSPYAGAWSVSGIYLDNGSEGIVVSDNVIVGLEEPLHQNLNNKPEIGQIPARNNQFLRNEGQNPATIAASGPRVE